MVSIRTQLVWLGTVSLLLGSVGCGVAEDHERLGSLAEELCSGAVLTGNPGGPVNAGATVTLTAANAACANGETAEYRFAYKRDGTNDAYTTIRNFGTSPTTAWSTAGLLPGKYLVVAYVRSVGSAASFQQIAYLNYLINGVCTSGTLAAAPAGPQPIGSQINLSATGSCTNGATPEFRYMYKRQDQTSYTQIAPYGSGAVSWDTTGLSSGTYSLLAYIRAAGNASTSEGTAYANYQLGGVCSSVTLATSPVSPQQPGTLVGLTATASCGGATPEYRFFYQNSQATGYTEIRPYGTSATANWSTTGLAGGTYTLLVQARVLGNGSSGEASGFGIYKLGFTAASVTAGAADTCVLLDSGVKCFGRNQLGAPTGQYSYDQGLETIDMGNNLPSVALGTGRTVKALARGSEHACALLDNDTVKCWGANSTGALGQGDTNHRSAGAGELGNALQAISLGTGRTARAISAGAGFTCAILDDGSVKCWGSNSYGTLGLGNVAHRGDGATEMGDSLPAVNLGTGRTAVSIMAGMSHVCAILDDASLKCWGLNTYGQLGIGSGTTIGDSANEMGDNLPVVDVGTGRHAVSLALGGYHTCAILDDASLKCWGYGAYGATGQNSKASKGDGPGEMGDTLPIVPLGTGRSATRISAGGHHTCAVLDNGSVKCWGYNLEGQLGLGHVMNKGDEANEMGDTLPAVNLGVGRTATRILTTQSNSCAALDNGTVKCWGAAYAGMLGIGPSGRRGDEVADMGDNLPAFSLGSARTVSSLGSGFSGHFGCALLDNATVKCWGSNSSGQLGIGRSSNVGDEPGDLGAGLTYVSLGTKLLPISVANGEHHSCALLSNATVKCWGANLYGSSGLGDTARHDGRAAYLGNNLPAVALGTGRSATAIAAGANHSCAILDNGTTKCWGQNNYGQLGAGDKNDRGDVPAEVGDGLPTVNLGTGRTAKALSLGYRHSCAILDDDTLKCWGWNFYGQLGLSSNTDRGDQAAEMGDALPVVALGAGRHAVRVTAGYLNTCAILDDGTSKCWGDNTHGQLGVGDKLVRGNKVNQMGDALPALSLGTGRTAQRITLGVSHACALLDNGTVKCWGYGISGKLGYGDVLDRGDAANEMGDNLPVVDFGVGQVVTSLASGWDHNCVLLAGGAGSVRCWGNGSSGSLGQGDNVTRGDNPGEMGSALPSVDLGPP